MNMYAKAAAQLRKEGIVAFTHSDGGLFINAGKCDFELSLKEVQKWAKLYDNDDVEDIRNSDPRYLLTEIAKIFHTHGWVLGDAGIEPEVIEANENFLELIYRAFKPQRN
jgi:hypothetical protein